jgi:hypothetical protein
VEELLRIDAVDGITIKYGINEGVHGRAWNGKERLGVSYVSETRHD